MDIKGLTIAQAKFPSPFDSGLEYSAPARGPWNIVHLGMLIPGAHQIFVCAQGCLRGVVLTAAEMGAQKRFSTIAIRENNLLAGDMEQLIIEGTANIIAKLPTRPPAILIYTSCIHHFMGCDLTSVYNTLAKRFPDIEFTDCYMDPIMRKRGLNPDQTMRRQLYSLLKPLPLNPRSVHIVGCCFPLDKTAEIYTLLTDNGFTVQEISASRSYEEYEQLAESGWCITLLPAANAAAKELERRLGQKHIYLPFSFNWDQIAANLTLLCHTLGINEPDFKEPLAACQKALKEAHSLIGATPIAIDYTSFPNILGLARLLLEQGFNVTKVFADSFSAEDKADFTALQKSNPDLTLYPTVHSIMRVYPRKTELKTLAIGQKAAYFTGTEHFVNIVEGGGKYGFSCVKQLAELMQEAFLKPKNTRELIQIKGMGCNHCL